MTARFGVPNACIRAMTIAAPSGRRSRWISGGATGRGDGTRCLSPTRCIAQAQVTRRCCRLSRDWRWTVRKAQWCAPARSNSWSNLRLEPRVRAAPTRRVRPRSGTRLRAPGLRPQRLQRARGARGRRSALTPAQINALIGAAADPEPMVRAQAVNALLASGDRDRVLAPLLARLTDTARVVRARAAEALLSFGVAELPGIAGVALSRAQNDYAQSLRDFPDVPGNHAALGWLESERNRPAEAHSALDTAIRLDPRAARPLVVKGVLAARAGNFAEAIEFWQKAKSLDPTYPNIDRMIAEAERRKGQ